MAENTVNNIPLQDHLRALMDEVSAKLREVAESQKETDRIVRRSSKQMGDLHRRFGELAEHLVVPGIKKRFNALGFNFAEVFENAKLDDASGNRITEVDVLLESRDTVMVVEVKSRPSEEDIAKHINRMGVLRRRADNRNDTRIYLGAIAGAIMPQNIRDCIVKNGFYAVEQSGDTMMINVPDNFKPRHW